MTRPPESVLIFPMKVSGSDVAVLCLLLGLFGSPACRNTACLRSADDLQGKTFRSMDVEIEATAGPLSGTLVLPEGKGPFPGIVILAGSGPTDRDGNNSFLKGPVNNLKDLAEHLARQGFASLRCDKRGVGKSPAGEKPVDKEILVGDARVAFDFLSGREEIKEGMVIAMEPGIFRPGVGPVRVEDDVLVTDTGTEMLTKMEYDEKLFPV